MFSSTHVVEMREARFRALTHEHENASFDSNLSVEMREARFRALTQDSSARSLQYHLVEMGEARFRALTLYVVTLTLHKLQL